MDKTVVCKARRQGDEMHCGRCGLTWDINDENRPRCKTPHEIAIERIREILKRERVSRSCATV